MECYFLPFNIAFQLPILTIHGSNLPIKILTVWVMFWSWCLVPLLLKLCYQSTNCLFIFRSQYFIRYVLNFSHFQSLIQNCNLYIVVV